MNPDQPSREHIEARLTALLLGELPADEAELLRYTIAHDPALKKLHDELAATIVLVREAVNAPADAPAEKAEPLKLSGDRREKLLAHFQTAPKGEPLFWLKRINVPSTSTMVIGACLLLLFGGLVAISIPNFVKSRASSQASSVMNNLRQIDAAKNQWALENNKSPAAVPTPADLSPYLVNGGVKPVAGESYVIGKVSGPVIAKADTKKAREQLGSDVVMLPSSGEPQIAMAEKIVPPALAPATPAPVEVASASAPAATPPLSSPRIALPAAEPLSINYATTSDTAGAPAAVDKDQIAGVANSMPLGVARGGGEVYVIKSGDTLSKIAQEHGTTVKALEEANNLTSTKILAGKKMKLPEPPDSDFRGTTFAVNEPVTTSASILTDAGGGGGGFGGGNVSPGSTFQMRMQNANPQQASQVLEKTFSSENAPQSAAARPPGQSPTLAQAELPKDAAVDSFGSNGVDLKSDQAVSGLSDTRKVFAPAEKPRSISTERVEAVAALRAAPAAMPAGQFPDLAQAQPPKVDAKTRTLDFDDSFSETGAEKVPIVGDVPVAGNLFKTSYSSIVTTNLAENTAGFQFQNGVAADDLAKTDGSLNKFTGGNYQADTNALVLNGVYAFAGKSSDHDDVSGLRYLISTNAVAVQTGGGGTINSTPGVSALAPRDINGPLPIQEEKRELADLEVMRGLLQSKVKMAKIDYDLPTYTMVQPVDPAKANKNQSWWQEFKGEYASTATMKVENEGAIFQSMEGGPAAQSYAYDPFFIQTTAEVIKSQLVLTNVVNSLNLESKWAALNGGQRMSMSQAMERLKSEIEIKPVTNTKMLQITATSSDPQEAADIANAVTKAYQSYRVQNTKQIQQNGLKVLQSQLAAQENQIAVLSNKLAATEQKQFDNTDRPLPKPAPDAPIPQPEFLCAENNFSTFSLNVSDVSFQLAAASLEHGQLPDAASIRSEEFINAFDYRDPAASAGQPMAFATERARDPFAQNRDLLRFSVKTSAIGRPAGRALNLVVLLDISGSMERADRVAIIHEALRVLASQLQPQDTVSVVTFARTARLWADGISGDKAGETLDRVGGITPEGGTNLEEAMRLAYEAARRHYLANGMNRVVLLTDGAANLGDVDPKVLQQNVETQRKQGIALDCFGVGFEDYNDDLLEQLSSHGDGRYAFLNSPEDASTEFATKLAGALQIAAQDVKVQVEFNPQRVISWRQIGYAKHQLTKEQFRDNTVAAGEIAAQEAGNALYTVETKPDGIGPVATVRVRYRVPGTQDYQEKSWLVDYNGTAPALEQASPAMRLTATAAAFSEWLATSPFAQEVTLDELQKILTGVPQVYGADERPKKLETMLREARSISGK